MPKGPAHSHSIVAGGLPEMSYTTRLMPRTSLIMRFETRPSRSCGRCAWSWKTCCGSCGAEPNPCKGRMMPARRHGTGAAISQQEKHRVGAWRSLVAHLHGVQGVPSSNLGAPTNHNNNLEPSFYPGCSPNSAVGMLTGNINVALATPP